MKNRSRQGTVPGAAATLLAETLALPAGVITAAVLTRSLGPEIYGRFTVVAATLAIAEWLLIAVFARAVVKFIAEADDWRGVAATSFRVYLVTGAAIGLGFWIMADAFAGVLRDPALAVYFRLFAPQIPLFAAGAACRNVLAGQARYREQAIAIAVGWIARVAFIAGFVYAGWGIRGAIMGSIGGTAVGAVAAMLIVGSAAWGKPGLPVRQLVQLAVPVFISMVSVRLLDQIGLFALKAFGSQAADVGFYGAAANVFMLTGIIGAGLTPVLISGLSAARYAETREGVEQLATGAMRFGIALLPVAAIVAGSAAEITPLLFGTAFAPAAPLIALLIVAAVLRANMAILSAILIGLDRAWLVALLAVPLPAIALAAQLVVIPSRGATGAALVTVVVAVLGTMAFVVAAVRSFQLRIPWSTVARSAVLSAVTYAIAIALPTPGLLVLVKAAALGGGVALAFYLSGEITPAEIQRLRGRPASQAPAE